MTVYDVGGGVSGPAAVVAQLGHVWDADDLAVAGNSLGARRVEAEAQGQAHCSGGEHDGQGRVEGHCDGQARDHGEGRCNGQVEGQGGDPAEEHEGPIDLFRVFLPPIRLRTVAFRVFLPPIRLRTVAVRPVDVVVGRHGGPLVAGHCEQRGQRGQRAS